MAGHCTPFAGCPSFLKTWSSRATWFFVSEVLAQPLAEVPVACLFDQLGQRFDDLIFRIIDVFEPVQQQIIHCLDVFPEQSHDALPYPK